MSETGYQSWPVAEPDQEIFVSRHAGLEKLLHCFDGTVHSLAHAAAGIEEEAHGDGSLLAEERFDFLLDVILEDPERFHRQTRDGPIPGIGNGHRYQDL